MPDFGFPDDRSVRLRGRRKKFRDNFPDIRRYFGGGPGKSALTDLRASRGTPPRVGQSSKDTQKKLKKSKKTVTAEELLSDASDDENPLPRSLRREFTKKRGKKRIVLSSDDDDELPASVSQQQPPSKRCEKISPKNLHNKPTKSSPRKRSAPVTVDDDKEEEDEDLDEFVPAPPTKKKRAQTPPGQTKLDFSNRATGKKKDSPKGKTATKTVPELEAINPVEFFRNFGKTSEETKKANEQSKGIKAKSPKQVTEEITLSSHASPRKAKHGRTESVAGTSDMAMLSDDSEPSSGQTQTKTAKPKKSPKTAESTKKIPTSPKEKEAKKKKKEVEKKKKISEIREETVEKAAKKTDAAEETKSSAGSRVAEQQKKLPKSKKAVEGNIVKIDKPNDFDVLAAPKETSLPWVDKYKPSNLKHLVGQNGEKSPMNKLLSWLRNWANNHLGEGGKQKKARPPPWLAQNDGTAFKAVMLSGPPGVGKTTCAVMACKEFGLRYVEKNASDVRNKKVLEAQTSELIDSQQMDGYMNGSTMDKAHKSNEITHVLIMDEVDGMSGNDDRAGIAELIQMIKETRIPIICICNDRQSQKMRSLVNYCFDLRFQRPRVEQIRVRRFQARLLTIACQERFKADKEEIDEIIETSQHDVRQSIYNLQLLISGGRGSEMQRKDAAVNPFEAARRLLRSDTPIWEKQQMFFVDYSIMPLFVQENYPMIQNSKMNTDERLAALKKAAENISQGDVVDRTIRTTGAWTLLNEQALFSSMAPTTYMNGYMKGMINFPSWLGKNSTMNKRQRLLRQLTAHTYLRTLAAASSMVLDYIPVLRHRYCCPLLDKEGDGVNDVIELYKEYNLIKDDTESIAELTVWPGLKDPGVAIPPRVKAALTRALNKEHIMLPYALDTVAKGRRKTVGGTLDPELDEEGNLIELGDGEDDLEGSEEENDSNDDVPVVTKKKTGATNESEGTRGGRGGGGRGAANRGGRGAGGRGGGGGRGRGRGSKK